ncbi:hypothetical protein Tco_1386982 [Tanacetum coccineum]
MAVVLTAHEATRTTLMEAEMKLSGGSGAITHATHGCTYKEFLNYQPCNFKETDGAFRLARWFEKMESIFHINNCAINFQVSVR